MQRILLFLLILVFFAGCKKNKPASPAYKILILGNSITYSPADPSIGWNGTWGMAATTADRDYVHLLTAKFKEINTSTSITATNIAAFEIGFDNYDFDQELKTFRDEKPDMLILRIGENVTRNSDAVLFEQKYQELLAYFKTNNPSIKILAVGSAWPLRDMPNDVLRKYSTYVSLDDMHSNMSFYAFGQFSDGGVASHPSDKGMAFICDAIFKAAKPILYP